jgi:hypothetical protein
MEGSLTSNSEEAGFSLGVERALFWVDILAFGLTVAQHFGYLKVKGLCTV